jgi:hypothetical protein
MAAMNGAGSLPAVAASGRTSAEILATLRLKEREGGTDAIEYHTPGACFGTRLEAFYAIVRDPFAAAEGPDFPTLLRYAEGACRDLVRMTQGMLGTLFSGAMRVQISLHHLGVLDILRAVDHYNRVHGAVPTAASCGSPGCELRYVPSSFLGCTHRHQLPPPPPPPPPPEEDVLYGGEDDDTGPVAATPAPAPRAPFVPLEFDMSVFDVNKEWGPYVVCDDRTLFVYEYVRDVNTVDEPSKRRRTKE